MRGIGISPASGIPGLPIGPIFFRTRTDDGVTWRSGESILRAKSSEFSKTTAGPEWVSRFRSFDADAFITAPFGARFPCSTIRLEFGYSGSDNGHIIRDENGNGVNGDLSRISPNV